MTAGGSVSGQDRAKNGGWSNQVFIVFRMEAMWFYQVHLCSTMISCHLETLQRPALVLLFRLHMLHIFCLKNSFLPLRHSFPVEKYLIFFFKRPLTQESWWSCLLTLLHFNKANCTVPVESSYKFMKCAVLVFRPQKELHHCFVWITESFVSLGLSSSLDVTCHTVITQFATWSILTHMQTQLN